MSENKSVKNNSSKRDSHENHRNVLLKQLAKPFGFLLLFIMVCAFLARYLTDSETLTEYARNNPELAYGTGKAAQTASPSQDSAPQINTETVLRSADQTDAADTPKTSSIDTSDTPAA